MLKNQKVGALRWATTLLEGGLAEVDRYNHFANVGIAFTKIPGHTGSYGATVSPVMPIGFL